MPTLEWDWIIWIGSFEDPETHKLQDVLTWVENLAASTAALACAAVFVYISRAFSHSSSVREEPEHTWGRMTPEAPASFIRPSVDNRLLL